VAEPNALGKLIERLIKLTKADKVEWTETAEETTFLASFPQYNVSITKKYAGQNWGEDYYEYRITVRDTAGKILEDAGDSDLSQFHFEGYDNSLFAMRFLYEQARRKALKVDEAISKLLSSLDDIE
jgi:hypothetical protein